MIIYCDVFSALAKLGFIRVMDHGNFALSTVSFSTSKKCTHMKSVSFLSLTSIQKWVKQDRIAISAYTTLTTHPNGNDSIK